MTLRKSSPPIVPRRAEAPITATEVGWKNDSSDAATAEWSRSAMRSSTSADVVSSNSTSTTPST